MSNSVQTPKPMSNSVQTPEPMMMKKDVAKFLQWSERQVELMVKAGKLPKPVYISDASPRWQRSVIEAWLEQLESETNPTDSNN